MITNPSVFDSSQNRGVLIPVCSRSESETFRESWVISRRAEVCQQSEPGRNAAGLFALGVEPLSAGSATGTALSAHGAGGRRIRLACSARRSGPDP
ncbi:hypothetical protein FJ546_08020 [Mesorhizobium sp. B2-4-19]|nr:hypothetical protein FJ546_08020 [Mesorhizobium sp. B2-4-19]